MTTSGGAEPIFTRDDGEPSSELVHFVEVEIGTVLKFQLTDEGLVIDRFSAGEPDGTFAQTYDEIQENLLR